MHRAHAKINLGLRIIGRRADGYHDIETIFHRVSLHDGLELEASGQIEVTSSSPEAPGGEGNLCYQAVRLLQDHLNVRAGARIHIQKAIPVGAGLGGGSSDAALVLRELPRLWGIEVTDESLREMALKLGSDVPYFLGAGSALARGRGEQLQYIRLSIPFVILLCYPNIHVSTAWAYRQARVSGTGPDLLGLLQQGLEHPALLQQSLQNDFEPTVLAAHPEIRRAKEEMLEGGALYASLSGSGSSVFGFFRTEEEATGPATRFRARGYTTSTTPPGFLPA